MKHARFRPCSQNYSQSPVRFSFPAYQCLYGTAAFFAVLYLYFFHSSVIEFDSKSLGMLKYLHRQIRPVDRGKPRVVLDFICVDDLPSRCQFIQQKDVEIRSLCINCGRHSGRPAACYDHIINFHILLLSQKSSHHPVWINQNH